MIPQLRRLATATATVAALAIAAPAAAGTTYSTDFSDIWWNPAEDGWGVQIVQQYNVAFATVYVYGADGQPRWFVGPELTGSPTSFSFSPRPWQPAHSTPRCSPVSGYAVRP